MAGWIREFDWTRFIHYEGAIGMPSHPEYRDKGVDVREWELYANPKDADWVDCVSRMYPTIEQLETLAKSPYDNRPVIMCEYDHAM